MLPVIAITNQTTVLTDDQVKAVIPALQRQVTEHYKAYWQQDATLNFIAKGDPLPAGWWELVVIDDPDLAGALGYHDLSSQGTPLGKVFAKLDLESGQSWTVTMSHELLEMLGDPWIYTCAADDSGKVYALEVADAVEADELGYEIDNVLVSDFVTPKWFSDAVEGDRYSFQKHVAKPFELALGGYISVLGPDGWGQITAERLGAVPLHMLRMHDLSAAGVTYKRAPEGSRRQRRTNKLTWRRSER